MKLKQLIFLLFLMSTYGCKQSTDSQPGKVAKDQRQAKAPSPKSNYTEQSKIEPSTAVHSQENVASENLSTKDKEVLSVKKTVDLAGEKDSNAASRTTAKTTKKPAKKVKKNSKTKVSTKKKKAPKPKKQNAEITFKEVFHDFGEITEGDVISHEFLFTNTSKQPLEIVSATATCGCTRPTFPFITIAPGESHQIAVAYHSVGKDGPQNPEITVTANTDPKITILKLSGTVVPKDKDTSSEKDTLQDSPIKSVPKDTTVVKESPTPDKSKKPAKVSKNASTKINMKRDTVK